MSVHVFVGPTIPAQTVRDRLPGAHVHPPVRHGDLLALPLQPGDAVAIVDGVFLRTGAIRHKELLHVMQEGVDVWGASSMGALRAAELDVFGMRGIGHVYDLYAGAVVTADDEVAVMHAEVDAGYRAMNEALVSVRVAARRARERDVLTAAEEELLVSAARRMFFADRTYPRIIESARAQGLPPDAAAGFSEYVANAAVDVKREDAELLLDELGPSLADPAARPRQAEPPAVAHRAVPRMEMTSFLLRWIRSAPKAIVDGEFISDVATLTACQLFAADYPALHYAVLLRELVQGELGTSAAPGDDDLAAWELLACKAAARRGLITIDAREIPESFVAWVSEAEREGPVQQAIARGLVRSLRWVPNVRLVEPLVDALAGTEAWRTARCQVARALQVNAQIAVMKPSFNAYYISDAKLHAWLLKRWQTTDLWYAMQDRGFSSEADLRGRAAEFLALDSLQGVPAFSVNASDSDAG